MNPTRILLVTVLAAFTLFSVYAIEGTGYFGLLAPHFESAGGLQVLLDLVIALSLVLVWMYQDSKARGTAFLPYLVLTLTLGSIGPLLYLVRRAFSAREPAAALRTAAREHA